MPKRNSPAMRAGALLDDLLGLARSRDSLPCDCLRSVQAHQVNKYEVDGATLSFPLLGHFKYRERDSWLNVRPGQILVVPNARSIDIEYIPDREKGEFVALSVVLMNEQLEAARLLLAAPPPTEVGKIAAIPVASLLDPLTRWTRAMYDGQRALSLHAMVEAVLCLYESGYTAILHPRAPSTAMTIRKLVTKDPSHRWNSSEIEGLTGLSGPTLRRRMAEESTTLRAVIADARVSEALRLLMTSRLPVKTVAARVGYNSVTSFSRQFFERYGIEPSQFR
ncbi:helix-turn-helix transcriptional regulator [Paraburkholderia phosphatilytica]|uniref:helix-turn-helix transcriptional regulator n=1 Tax=Paraburkholderia phosphatilytica TaxID=2282883 RepID=UPI000E509854|nr:AraC family transcriptional regulator [Paraburkholderia phosphatilytica]